MKFNILFTLVVMLGMGAPYLNAMEKDEVPADQELTSKELELPSLSDVLFNKKTLGLLGATALGVLGYQNRTSIKEKAEEGAKVISENKGKTAMAVVAAGLAAYAVKRFLATEEENPEEENNNEEAQVSDLFLGGTGKPADKGSDAAKLEALPEWQKCLGAIFVQYKGADKQVRFQAALRNPLVLLADKAFLKTLLPDTQTKFVFVAMLHNYNRSSTLSLIAQTIGCLDVKHKTFAENLLKLVPQNDSENIHEMIEFLSQALVANADSKKFTDDEAEVMQEVINHFTSLDVRIVQFMEENKDVKEFAEQAAMQIVAKEEAPKKELHQNMLNTAGIR